MARRKAEFEGEKMVRGCIVRHLVLPLCTDDSVAIVEKFARLDTDARFSLMGQYLPCGEADAFPELRRRITSREYKKVLRALLRRPARRAHLRAGAFVGGRKIHPRLRAEREKALLTPRGRKSLSAARMAAGEGAPLAARPRAEKFIRRPDDPLIRRPAGGGGGGAGGRACAPAARPRAGKPPRGGLPAVRCGGKGLASCPQYVRTERDYVIDLGKRELRL